MVTRSSPVQRTFDELGTPLRETTFVVVDLETTGSTPVDCAITEIGAVKVRGGELLGKFSTLVNPGRSIPPFIAVLTGITDGAVAGAPAIDAALPAFLEFAAGAVLVAHNAPFDLGFLRAACEQTGRQWPAPSSVDTVRLARKVVHRDEAPDCRLATLARLFRTSVTPCHRALADAEATVEVLHCLLERLGNLGVQTIEELQSFVAQVSPAQRRKRHLADPLPHSPGVYLFRDERGRVLYIGTAGDLRTRVRRYFMASEERTRMAEMVALADRVEHIVCAHALEAQVRELRLIAEHKPHYNRRSRFPERQVLVKLTVEAFPRLSIVRGVASDDATYLGPFPAKADAELAIAAVHDAVPLRQCTGRLAVRSRTPACMLADLGRCGAPCDGRESQQAYFLHVERARRALAEDPEDLYRSATARLERLSRDQRYEDARVHRDRLAALLRAGARHQRLTALTRLPLLVAARVARAGGWEVSVVRHGRLVAAGLVPRAAAPRPFIDALVATAETVVPAAGPTPAALVEESECVLRWLDGNGTRLVSVEGEWSCPVRGAERFRSWCDDRQAGRLEEAPFRPRVRQRTVHQPARPDGAAGMPNRAGRRVAVQAELADTLPIPAPRSHP